MSCDHRLLEEHAHDYLTGSLPQQLRQQCEDALAECGECRTVLAEARIFQQFEQQWCEQAVPEWHRNRFAVQPRQSPNTWLGWSALITSCLAMLMILFNLELNFQDGLIISFDGSEAKLERMLEQRMDDFRQEQASANQLLLTAWLEQNRRERRDELNFIMSIWQNQRQEDQRQIIHQFDYLADNQIESNEVINDLLRNAHYYAPEEKL